MSASELKFSSPAELATSYNKVTTSTMLNGAGDYLTNWVLRSVKHIGENMPNDPFPAAEYQTFDNSMLETPKTHTVEKFAVEKTTKNADGTETKTTEMKEKRLKNVVSFDHSFKTALAFIYVNLIHEARLSSTTNTKVDMDSIKEAAASTPDGDYNLTNLVTRICDAVNTNDMDNVLNQSTKKAEKWISAFNTEVAAYTRTTPNPENYKTFIGKTFAKFTKILAMSLASKAWVEATSKTLGSEAIVSFLLERASSLSPHEHILDGSFFSAMEQFDKAQVESETARKKENAEKKANKPEKATTVKKTTDPAAVAAATAEVPPTMVTTTTPTVPVQGPATTIAPVPTTVAKATTVAADVAVAAATAGVAVPAATTAAGRRRRGVAGQ
jgi:arsenate reductase-like glutaredoxin family protein